MDRRSGRRLPTPPSGLRAPHVSPVGGRSVLEVRSLPCRRSPHDRGDPRTRRAGRGLQLRSDRQRRGVRRPGRRGTPRRHRLDPRHDVQRAARVWRHPRAGLHRPAAQRRAGPGLQSALRPARALHHHHRGRSRWCRDLPRAALQPGRQLGALGRHLQEHHRRSRRRARRLRRSDGHRQRGRLDQRTDHRDLERRRGSRTRGQLDAHPDRRRACRRRPGSVGRRARHARPVRGRARANGQLHPHPVRPASRRDRA